jgi:acyl carrier protein
MSPDTTVIHSKQGYDEALEQVRTIIGDALQLEARSAGLNVDTPLLGNLPELDSMAVISVISALEGNFDFEVSDDDDIAEAFESVGTLVKYVKAKSRN